MDQLFSTQFLTISWPARHQMSQSNSVRPPKDWLNQKLRTDCHGRAACHSFHEEMQKGHGSSIKRTFAGRTRVAACKLLLDVIVAVSHFERRWKWRPVFLSITFVATQLPPPPPLGGPSTCVPVSIMKLDPAIAHCGLKVLV
jgi:hypothetical protein